MVALGPLGGMLVRTQRAKLPMLLGGLLLAAAFALLAIAHDHIWQIVVSEALAGAGIGLALASTADAIINIVPATQTGEATSANAIARTIGTSISTAAIAALLAAHSSAHAIPANAGFTIAFWTGTAVALVGVLATLVAPATRRMPAP